MKIDEQEMKRIILRVVLFLESERPKDLDRDRYPLNMNLITNMVITARMIATEATTSGESVTDDDLVNSTINLLAMGNDNPALPRLVTKGVNILKEVAVKYGHGKETDDAVKTYLDGLYDITHKIIDEKVREV